MTNRADPDQLASSEALIWIYTVCIGRVYPGSAGQGLSSAAVTPAARLFSENFEINTTHSYPLTLCILSGLI